jgi:hypothetical protein
MTVSRQMLGAEVLKLRRNRGLRYATGVAVVVLALWVAVPTALGAWRSRTQDA